MLTWPEENKRYSVQNNNNQQNYQYNSGYELEDVKHQHGDVQGGGYYDIYTYADGSTQTITVSPCFRCFQNGICPFCNGTGKVVNGYGMYAYVDVCYMCHATGKCSICSGMGNWINVIWGQGNRYLFISNSGASGSGVVVPHVYSDDHIGPSSQKSRSYIEKKQYAPDYTGNQVKVYCDKCGSYAYPHAHLKIYSK